MRSEVLEVKANADHRSEYQMTIGRIELDALIRACLGLRARVLDRDRFAAACGDEPRPDFEDTIPAARPSVQRMP
jgi:hypothetical protein